MISFNIKAENFIWRTQHSCLARRRCHNRVQNGSGAHPSSFQCVQGALSLGVKRTEREADHSPPSSAEVKECVELYFRSPNTLHDVVLS